MILPLRPKALWIAAAVVVLALAACGAIWLWCRSLTFYDAADRDFDANAVSADLDADLRLMWQTESLRSGEGEASTLTAILAASRVFNTVSLVGMTGAETKAVLGPPLTSNVSVYRGQAFWPLRSRGMIYRFDCGTCGWQFNVYCEGDDAPVTEVERRWIH